ncbi:MAG: response regulator [bacterium]
MATTIGYYKSTGTKAKARYAPLPSPGLNACVLLVEDHEDTRFMLRTMLELRGGISVVEADNGFTAIDLARSLHPDLILIDSNLPMLDGYEATRRIREFTATREVPIVFLSGHAQPEAENKAFAAGCTDYLVKPFGLEKLGNVLERYLSQKAN